jgi:hypothetical protein
MKLYIIMHLMILVYSILNIYMFYINLIKFKMVRVGTNLEVHLLWNRRSRLQTLLTHFSVGMCPSGLRQTSNISLAYLLTIDNKCEHITHLFS